jgi:hypothetical protein
MKYPNNYDENTNLNWHRKVGAHPDAMMERIATDYCARLAAEFEIDPPGLFWFEEATDASSAIRAWDKYPRPKGLWVDPMKMAPECEYFPMAQRGPRGPQVIGGYTGRASPFDIMINVNRRNHDLLSTVAHEFFHFLSRQNGESMGDEEPKAREFERSRSEEIEAFAASHKASVSL